MNSDFLKKWDGDGREPVLARVNGRFHHKAPMKEQLAATVYRLKVQENKLESAAVRMQQHDREIFTKCVNSQMAHDTARASMYANECAEVRKMAKVTLHCQLALEQVSLRLETVEEFGDMAKLMGPAAAVVSSIKNQISGLIPEVGFELSEIGEVLNNVVAEAGETVGSTYDMEASGAEAQKILTEANSIADLHIKDRFPELPASGVSTGQRSGELSPSR